MEGNVTAANSMVPGFRDQPTWLVAAAALVFAQAGLAHNPLWFGSSLESSDRPTAYPLRAAPSPPLSWHARRCRVCPRGATTCYDPQFQAGYPKTPVFDGGSRPAELFLLLSGGRYRPAAYKLGLFTFLLLVPAAFIAAARGAGFTVGIAVLSGVGGIVLGWSEPVRRT